jgi:hypothetical protein
MGNCLKGSTADDISLLRGSDGTRDSSSSEQLGPPPPYQVIILVLLRNFESSDNSLEFEGDLETPNLSESNSGWNLI